jgi:membrane associated rhomboid family serine protease
LERLCAAAPAAKLAAMSSPVSLSLEVTLILLCALLGRLQAGRAGLRLPWLTLLVAALVAAGLAAELSRPELLPQLRRDAAAVGRGEAWRLFTALWLQERGLPEGLFNLACLLVVGSVAETAWTRAAWLFVYLAAGLGAELVALAWKPIGAGNSVAVFGLAGSLLAVGARRGGGVAIRPMSFVGLALAGVMAWLHDIHGAAALMGAALGWLLPRAERRAAA